MYFKIAKNTTQSVPQKETTYKQVVPAGGASIRGPLGAASFLPYPNSFLLVG